MTRALDRGAPEVVDQGGVGAYCTLPPDVTVPVAAGVELRDQVACGIGLAHAGACQIANLLGCNLAALGEFAYLGSHHGKALAMLARACGLDGRIEREHIGLIGNVINDGDALGNALHRRDRGLHCAATVFGLLRGLLRGGVGQAGIFSVLLDGRGGLFQCGGGFFDRGRLL